VPSGDEILRQLKGMVFGDEDTGKSKPKSSKNKGGKCKKNTPNKRQQRVIMYCGRRRVFSLGCHTGRIIYYGTTLMCCYNTPIKINLLLSVV
jgi:hypothetical protein